MLRSGAESGGDQQRADLVAIQPDRRITVGEAPAALGSVTHSQTSAGRISSIRIDASTGRMGRRRW
jgi:hypothetical protein